jgi:hypothetical protein
LNVEPVHDDTAAGCGRVPEPRDFDCQRVPGGRQVARREDNRLDVVRRIRVDLGVKDSVEEDTREVVSWKRVPDAGGGDEGPTSNASITTALSVAEGFFRPVTSTVSV